MTAAVRKKDEELTINLKCIIGVLMTDSDNRRYND
ncbi:unknown [Prevotella sp. CAG:487]|nr:unknown [Prevotella sp. CAG:487]